MNQSSHHIESLNSLVVAPSTKMKANYWLHIIFCKGQAYSSTRDSLLGFLLAIPINSKSLILRRLLRRILIIGFFLVYFSGAGFSQKLDSLIKVKANRILVLDSLSKMDSLKHVSSKTRDSIQIISRKVNDLQQGIKRNEIFKEVENNMGKVVMPKLSEVNLPEDKMPKFKALELPQKPSDEKIKILKEKAGQISQKYERLGGQVDAISLGVDSLKNIQYLDSTLMDMGEAGMEMFEQDLLKSEELSGIPENDIKSAFSEKLSEGEIGENTSDLQKLDPKQIQQDFLLDKSKLEEAQHSLNKYKNKYTQLKDSRLERGRAKRYSLKEKKFFERSELSLLGNLTSFSPLEFQVSAGYRIDQHWTVGSGAILSTEKKVLMPDYIGIRGFGQYWVKEKFFIQVEYQNLNGLRAPVEEQAFSRSLVLGGLGTEVQVYKCIRLRSTVLYRVSNLDSLLKNFESQWQALIGIVLVKR